MKRILKRAVILCLTLLLALPTPALMDVSSHAGAQPYGIEQADSEEPTVEYDSLGIVEAGSNDSETESTSSNDTAQSMEDSIETFPEESAPFMLGDESVTSISDVTEAGSNDSETESTSSNDTAQSMEDSIETFPEESAPFMLDDESVTSISDVTELQPVEEIIASEAMMETVVEEGEDIGAQDVSVVFECTPYEAQVILRAIPEETIQEPEPNDAEEPPVEEITFFLGEDTDELVTTNSVYQTQDPGDKQNQVHSAPIEPDSDGVYHLLPGEYAYDVIADNYYSLVGASLTVTGEENPILVTVSLESSVEFASKAMEAMDAVSLSGAGTAENPYLIQSAEDWNRLADYLDSGNTLDEKPYFRQTADIQVTRKIGPAYHDFQGTYDGGGHTLCLIVDQALDSGTAPFWYAKNATIKNLRTSGAITIANTKSVEGAYRDIKFTSGLVGYVYDTVNIVNCFTDITIINKYTVDGTEGGFVGICYGTANITGCISEFVMLTSRSKNYGGFVGWRNSGGTVNITDSLSILSGFSTLFTSSDYATFCRNGCIIKNSYYWAGGIDLTRYNYTVQGKKWLEVSLPENVSVNLPDERVYGTSGLTFGSGDGFLYDGRGIAAAGDAFQIRIAATADQVVRSLNVQSSSGTFDATRSANDDNLFSFTMPNGNVTLSAAVFTPIRYIDEDGREQTCLEYTRLVTDKRDYNFHTLSDGWYVVDGRVDLNNAYDIQGDVRIILCDGCLLKCTVGGLDFSTPTSVNSLSIYGQREGTGTMDLLDGSIAGDTAIGTTSYWSYEMSDSKGYRIYDYSINIHGGRVIAQAYGGTAIGAREVCGGVTVNITGGYVEARGGSYETAIGGSYDKAEYYNTTGNKIYNSKVNISGGTVLAHGGRVGIGDRGGNFGTKVVITGGDIRAEGETGIGNTYGLADITLDHSGNQDIRVYASNYNGKLDIRSNFRVEGAYQYIYPGCDTMPTDATLIYCGALYAIDLGAADKNGNSVKCDHPGLAEANDTVLLTPAPAAGYELSDLRVTDNHGRNLSVHWSNGSYSFKMPETSVKVIPTFEKKNTTKADYIDARGTLQGTTDYSILVTEEAALDSGWYVVRQNISDEGRMEIDGDVHLILYDGATLTAKQGVYVRAGASLTLYGQNAKTGTLQTGAIEGDSTKGITINGGSIDASGAIGLSGGTLTLNGGLIAAGSLTGKSILLNHNGQDSGMRIRSGRYDGSLTLQKNFLNYENYMAEDGEILLYPAGDYSDTAELNGVTLAPVDRLLTVKQASEVVNGTLTASPDQGLKGMTVRMILAPNEGYALIPGTVRAVDATGTQLKLNAVQGVENAWTFTLPDADVTLYAEFEELKGVDYVDENGETQSRRDYIQLTEELPVNAAGDFILNAGWYAVSDSITLNRRVAISGDAVFILEDGVALDMAQGVAVTAGNSFTVYGQTGQSGKLIATATLGDMPGIGGGGTVTLNGGIVEATGGKSAAGIGAGNKDEGGSITINGGTVIAIGGKSAAGIGSCEGVSGIIAINGGTITATGGDGAAGIGAGDSGSFSSIAITGGTITVNGGEDGAGIGGGYKAEPGSIRVTGGKVTAIGGENGAGIGGGNKAEGGVIEILGGQITATGGEDSLGLGSHPKKAPASVTLGWTEIDDFIWFDDVNANVTIAEDQALVAENGNVYTGTVDFPITLAGQKLTPYQGNKQGGRPATGMAVYVLSASLTLKGQIGLNFRVKFSEAVKTMEGAKAVVVYKGETVSEVKLSELTPQSGTTDEYLISHKVPAKEIANRIGVQILDGSGKPIPLYNPTMSRYDGDVFEYSVTDYCARARERFAGTKLGDLIDALRAYGAYAWQHFATTDAQPTLVEAPDLSQVTVEKLASHKLSSIGAIEGVSLESMTLVLKSETSIKLRFKTTTEVNLADLQITSNNANTRLEATSDGFIVSLPDISARNLDNRQTITLSMGDQAMTVDCDALSYAYIVMQNGSVSQRVKNVVRALFLYNQAAKAYFGNN